ncbi:helix-turn-helix domain-containing protein [Streptomyces sp. NPDC058739]|uniref:helix-turn-helix domain-containing protein n=1 Tax=Streptomyces sp. NPDC058739 TaxID=3346618 RepID=UPI0036BE101B
MDAIQDDVAEFALLLTRLKERTDRSYAALARRLGMSASTLHRYCAGEAVPLSFTGIERFAALCGASPEERVELHRRWILAVAARQRPGTSDARRTQTPQDLPGTTASAASASPDIQAKEAERPRRRPSRSMALAAVLAVALAGLTTSAAGPNPGGGEPSPSARTAPEPSAPAPLTWTANSHLWQLECDHDYVIDKPPGQVPPPPTPQDAEVWAVSQGAVHGRTTNLRISVQGRGNAAVVLEALHVRVVGRTTPAAPQGTAYSMYEGCGAVLIPRHFAVDLDARRPLARSRPGNDPDRPAPAIDFPYRVSLREPEVLLLSAGTVSCTCDWFLELDWSSQGRSGTVRIDDHGRPFRTTGIQGLPHYWYRDPAGWIPMNP